MEQHVIGARLFVYPGVEDALAHHGSLDRPATPAMAGAQALVWNLPPARRLW